MKVSEKARDILKSIEVLRKKPYDDSTGKEITDWCRGATIGYGHLISKYEWINERERYREGLSKLECEMLFDSDCAKMARIIDAALQVELTQCQYDALMILTFNIGTGGLLSSSALRMINDPSAKTAYRSLEAAWKAWNKTRVNGELKVNNGLVNRRDCEWRIFSRCDYTTW